MTESKTDSVIFILVFQSDTLNINPWNALNDPTSNSLCRFSLSSFCIYRAPQIQLCHNPAEFAILDEF